MTMESSETEEGVVSDDSGASVVGAVGLSMRRSVQRSRPARTTVPERCGFRREPHSMRQGES
jgi:hypothetical protein